MVCRQDILFRTIFKISEASDPAQLLSLNCFVLGDKSNETFTVKIPKTENVSILKDLIKEKKAPDLNHVSASKLILSQALLPVDDKLDTVDRTPLDPLLPPSQLFPRVEETRLHIVVHAPPNGKSNSVILDDIINIVQSAVVPRTRKRKRGETQLLLWTKVRVFIPFSPSLINNTFRVSECHLAHLESDASL
jgi:hypothetical protein